MKMFFVILLLIPSLLTAQDYSQIKDVFNRNVN
jgi:hypothetical protein